MISSLLAFGATDRDRFRRLPAILVATGLLAGSLAAASETEGPWIEVRTPNFQVFSNASETTATEIARAFESLRAVLSGIQPNMRLNSPRPTYIYAFRSDERFAAYKPLETPNVSGIFISDPLADYVGLGIRHGLDEGHRAFQREEVG